MLQEKQNLVQAIIDIPELQQYFNLKEVKKTGLPVEMNDLITNDIKVYKAGNPINILSKKDLKKNNITRYWNIHFASVQDSIDFPETIFTTPKPNTSSS